MSKELIAAIAEMREDEAIKLVEQMLERGDDPAGVLEACREAMTVVGQRYESGQYFLPELILAGEMLAKIAEVAKPRIAGASVHSSQPGKVLIATVRGDIHDIGKNIVSFMMDVNGLEVLDLGVDVPPDRVVGAIREFKPRVVGLSGFLTLAYESMKHTVEAIEKAGLRGDVKIIIGGGQIDDTIRAYTGADAYGKDAMAGVNLAKQWIGAS